MDYVGIDVHKNQSQIALIELVASFAHLSNLLKLCDKIDIRSLRR